MAGSTVWQDGGHKCRGFHTSGNGFWRDELVEFHLAMIWARGELDFDGSLLILSLHVLVLLVP